MRWSGWHSRSTPRLALLLLILVSALLLPDFTVAAALPDVRVEQLLALPALLWVIQDWVCDRRLPRWTLLDWFFLALALSTLASILWAPLMLDGALSPRDFYEVLKLALYWTLFRFGVQTAERGSGGPLSTQRAALSILLSAGALAGAVGVAQYFNLLDLNTWATPLWAPAHHLRTLARDARAPGTVGNPNYFGMLSTIILLAAVAVLALCARRPPHWLAAVALLGAAAGLVSSASRGATLALVAGVCAVWLGVIVSRRDKARALVLATAAALLAVTAAVLLVEVAPRGRNEYLARMTGTFDDDGDGGLALRLERWRSVPVPWRGRGDNGVQDRAAAGPPPALNLLQNGDLERGGAHADNFRTLTGTRYEMTDGGLFGGRAALFQGNPAAPERRAALFQQRYLGRRGGAPLTAQLAVKLAGPIDGDLSLYANVFYADGARSDPHVRVPVDPTRVGVWQELTARIEPEAGRTVTYVGVYLMADGFRGEALVDGFALHDGAEPVRFPSLVETPPTLAGSDAAARLRRSLLLGAGPAKAEPELTAPTDNEYLLIAERYGIVGLLLYLALWGAVLVAMWRGLRGGGGGAPAALRLTVAATVAGLLVFNLVAGSFLHLQLMGLLWPLAGVAAARCADER